MLMMKCGGDKKRRLLDDQKHRTEQHCGCCKYVLWTDTFLLSLAFTLPSAFTRAAAAAARPLEGRRRRFDRAPPRRKRKHQILRHARRQTTLKLRRSMFGGRAAARNAARAVGNRLDLALLL